MIQSARVLMLSLALSGGMQAHFSAAEAPKEVAQPLVAPIIGPPEGFDEGTETELTLAKLDEILPWAKNSRVALQDLQEQVRVLGPRDARQALLRGIQAIVPASSPKRTETLMRYVLRRALKLDAVLEKEMQAGDPQRLNIQVHALKRAVQMALDFYESDVAFLEGQADAQSKASLPFARFGTVYVRFVMDLDRSILDASAQYEVALLSFGLFQWDLARDAANTRFAPAILKMHTFLQQNASPPGSDAQALQRWRQYLHVYQRVMELVTEADGTLWPITQSEAALVKRPFVPVQGRKLPDATQYAGEFIDSQISGTTVTTLGNWEIPSGLQRTHLPVPGTDCWVTHSLNGSSGSKHRWTITSVEWKNFQTYERRRSGRFYEHKAAVQRFAFANSSDRPLNYDGSGYSSSARQYLKHYGVFGEADLVISVSGPDVSEIRCHLEDLGTGITDPGTNNELLYADVFTVRAVLVAYKGLATALRDAKWLAIPLIP